VRGTLFSAMVFETYSLAEFEHAVGVVFESIHPGKHATILGLQGDLGTGKTTFVQLLARILGVSEIIVSPTFLIMKRYKTTHPIFCTLVHVDAYRLSGPHELEKLGFSKFLKNPTNIITVEWPERVRKLLTHSTLITLEDLGEGRRRIVTKGYVSKE
jgi:tRNA threonylcarbamoyladenosine biosynthesis protein TsaE